MYKFGVVSNDITFEPNFINICSAILKEKGESEVIMRFAQIMTYVKLNLIIE